MSWVGRLDELLSDDSGIDKLVPAVLKQAGETLGAAIENLNRMDAKELDHD